MKALLIQSFLLALPLVAQIASAAEPSDFQIKKWTVCAQDADCEGVHWGSCTLLAVNSKFREEVWHAAGPNGDPLQEMTVRDAECMNSLSTAPYRARCENKLCVFRPAEEKVKTKLQTAPYRLDA